MSTLFVVGTVSVIVFGTNKGLNYIDKHFTSWVNVSVRELDLKYPKADDTGSNQ